MEALSGGMFATECGQRFLQVLMEFTDKAFKKLYEKCQNNLQCDYYQQGLKSTPRWTDDAIQDDINHVIARFPDASEVYDMCFMGYVRGRYHGAAAETPPFADFVRKYYERISCTDAMTSGDYFKLKDPTANRFTCMDAARSACADIASKIQVVELASVVSSVRPFVKNKKSSEEMPEVSPQDSASQVGVRSQVSVARSVQRMPSVVDAVSPEPEPDSEPEPEPEPDDPDMLRYTFVNKPDEEPTRPVAPPPISRQVGRSESPKYQPPRPPSKVSSSTTHGSANVGLRGNRSPRHM